VRVEIDGVLYVPVTEAVPGIDDIVQALYESYMGSGKSWRDDPYSKHLYVAVNEDREGDSFHEFVARIVALRGNADA